ncbi:filamentous hemagglutinin N-terminal domain-containing protein [Nostoc sp. DedQUE09]|uniref:two-partner secretion domain-containing protein n=1 Tax=Nostoc sp. DedQUE09 TaxID=3075394 RepID=UPI002AD5009B|nr:filamentous hemagglutinin N-terminal domain-containing protein [Nostoc sp. DedQUE09]MDZ7952358.1 filamentous hemagglutinin N-terminal domain-containing protein [Nostoc sp. DedQUE09]
MSLRNWFGRGYHLGLSGLVILVGAIGIEGSRTSAQVTPDSSLGTKVESPDSTTYQITGGTTVGDTNLFHSFSNFSVKNQETVDFRNASSINNILVRVTGGNRSDIQGTLQAQGKANLFLINPKGIIFGKNAKLKINGSFLVTTASAIQFPGGGEFSMTSPVNSLNSLLRVNPSAFLFNQILSQPIESIQVNKTSQLSVSNSQSLVLVGGDVNLEGALLSAPDGRIELGGLAETGTIGLNINNNNFRLSFPDNVARANVSLTKRARITATGQGGGSIQVQGKRVTLTDDSTIAVNTLGSKSGGTLVVNALESVELLGRSSLLTETTSSGTAGELRIETGQLIVQDGSQVSASTSKESTGQGGKLFVTANSIQLIGISPGNDPSVLFTITEGAGSAGELKIETGQLIVQDGAQISASTRSQEQGKGGTLSVTADSIQLIGTKGKSRSALLVGTEGSGSAGNLEIETGQLIVQDGARISASTFAKSTGQGGNIIVKAEELNVLNGGEVTVSSRGTGNAGLLTVNANSITLDTQGKLTGTTASGRGGNISLQARDLILIRNRSAIATTAGNNGNGGNIRIDAPFIIALPGEDSDILANANQGTGGRIEINTTGIYGLENRTKLPPNPKISEINASSDFGLNGTVEINTPDVDPTRGLINLPTQLVDTEVTQACQADTAQNQSSFIITGRGGLPPNPRTEPLSSDAVQVDWVTLKAMAENHVITNVSTQTTSPTAALIVEAQGWMRNDKGEVVLTADASTATPQSSWQTPPNCRSDF